MASSFRSFLVNDLFGDPVLYVSLAWERRALLFDLGALDRLSAGRLLRVSDVFVSHAHLDHFVGFDHLLRVLLGRSKALRLYGPPGFLDQVEGKLRAYTWNLVEGYALVVEAAEIHADRVRRAAFACADGFRRRDDPSPSPFAGVVVDEPLFRVRARHLDHRIPCLGFVLEEPLKINIDGTGLAALGLPVGPWLMDVKRAVRAGSPDATPIRIGWSTPAGRQERELPLGTLKAAIVRTGRGQKVAYVTDVVDSPANAAAIRDLARDADLFYCEAAYPDRDRRRAEERFHLTAAQAGRLAAAAGARHLSIFHLSPKYRECAGELVAEALTAFAESRLQATTRRCRGPARERDAPESPGIGAGAGGAAAAQWNGPHE